jgi:hypothetical protein
MITLAPGDTLNAILSASGSMGATVFGESVPASGGPPSAWYNAVNSIATASWTGLAAAGSAQLLINQVVIMNYGATANGVALSHFPAATSTYVAGNMNLGGGMNGYVQLPASGMAVYARNGWKIFDSNGTVQGALIWNSFPYNTTNWADYGTGWATVAYAKNPNGMVQIIGMMKSVAAYTFSTASTLVLGTLPAGFRPATPTPLCVAFQGDTAGHFAAIPVYVSTAGVVNLSFGNSDQINSGGNNGIAGYLSVNGSFYATQ